MAIRGGYQIIDLRDTAFTSGEESSIENIYKLVSSPYQKPTLISGLIVSDVVYPDFYAPFITNGNNATTRVVIGTSTITIAVTSDDNITVTVA